MDLFSALQTSVSGLQAQAFSLGNISGNIANSQTVGYKRIDTDFADMLVEQPAKQQSAGGVAAFSQLTNSLQGGVAATGIPTNMALSGDGFFTVQTAAATPGGTPTFSGTSLYTRRGDFSVDSNGFLVNGAGAYLTGQSLDPVTGASTGTGPIKISNAGLPAKPTTSIAYAANLPNKSVRAGTPTSPTTASGNALLGTLPGGDPRVLSGSTATAPTVAASDSAAFVNSSIAGGELTAYSGTGTPVSLQMRWAKVANADATAGTGDTWNLYYANQTATGSTPATWQNAGTAFTFNGSGQLTSPTGTSLSIPNVTVNGTNLGAVALNVGTGGLTQYGSAGGQVTTTTLQQNGYAAGTLNSLAVTSDGKLTGTYSNGNSVALAQVGVVRFNAPNSLKAVSGGNYAQTAASGGPLAGLSGSTIVGGNVERSNTDTAGEFSKLIVTQQAYSANTRVMSTAQQMMSDLINVIR